MVTIVDDRNLGYALGATDYLTKPIDRERLAALRPEVPAARGPRSACSSWRTTPNTRDMLRKALERDGWQVAEAENGRLGLEEVARQRPGPRSCSTS